MKQSINFSQFCDAFRDYGRNDNFSYEGKQALFEYLEQYGEETGEEVELDIIALCCDYTESTYNDVYEEYLEYSYTDEFKKEFLALDDEERIETIKSYLNDNTFCIEVNDTTCIYQAF